MSAHPAQPPAVQRPACPRLHPRLNLHPGKWGVQAYAELGVAVALAAVLGQVRLFTMPQGGSVSLELLPIVFIAVRRGVAPALTAGVVYGLLQLVLPGAFVYHPAQALLDYPLAFGALAAVFLDGDYEDAGYYRRWALGADLVVAADGGGRFLASAGIVPDVLVGDFDSLDEAAVAEAASRGARIVRHPAHKDQTDGELAVDEALHAGADELVLAGALGALDHVLGHLALLGRVEARGTAARLVAPGMTVRVLVAPAGVRLDAGPGTRVSLAPLAGDALATLSGLEYELDHGRLPGDACLGLGNAVAGPAAAVTVHEGRVAVLVFCGVETFGGLSAPGVPRAGA